MCGIAGVVLSTDGKRLDLANVVGGMISRVVHRGPDDQGVWIDGEAGIGLGHCRLAIIDLSPAGRQPMTSSDGRFVITYNGELYNYLELRREIDRIEPNLPWKSNSDTEVILEATRIWGFGRALSKFTGMFALALWDRSRRSLVLARDRLGEKPLYFGWVGSAFCFASELKGFRGIPEWRPEVDSESVGLYFRLGCVPAPRSILQGVRKLEPACYFELGQSDIGRRALPEVRRYWTLPGSDPNHSSRLDRQSSQRTEEELEQHLARAVRRQLVADVPVGALLSGGVDSSAIAAFAQAMTPHRLQTYTVAFHESEYSESKYARAIANHLGTDHTELYVTPQDALQVVPQLPAIYDEPLSDPSQIPTFLVSRLASRYVKVCLSGDGGDELFGGYNRHIWGSRIPRWLAWVPVHARRRLLTATLAWLGQMRKQNVETGRTSRISSAGLSRLYKLSDVVCAVDAREAYATLISHWKPEERLLTSATEPAQFELPWNASVPAERAMMNLDASWYLPEDILLKLDRAAMAVSLETRVPFLDHELVEFASTIPVYENFGLTSGKKLLRKVLHKHVPRHLVDRPKMGFWLPIDQWLRGPLREWVEDLISASSLARHGLLSGEVIASRWKQQLSGERDYGPSLWDVVTFQAWFEANIKTQ